MAACVAQTAMDLDEGISAETGGGFCGRLGVGQREIEENLWRAIRHGMDGEMIDFRHRRVVPTRQVLEELESDISRLSLVAERFSKIGSVPQLHAENVKPILERNANYMRRRASEKNGRGKPGS